MRGIQELLANGRLKSLRYDGVSLAIEEKTAPSYDVTFVVINKKLQRQKKACKVIEMNVTAPQDQLHYVWADILDKIHELEAKETPEQASEQ